MKKTFTYTMVVDWKTGHARLLKKRNNKKMKPYEIPIEVKLNIDIPEPKILQAEGNITVSETKAERIVMEEVLDNV